MADQHDDLEQLLDSALDDFQNLNLAPATRRSGDGNGENSNQKEKEICLPSLPTGVQGLGMGLPDLKRKQKGKQKVSKASHVEEALVKLREQTREAVKGLESVTSAPKPDDSSQDAFMDDWVKQFEELAGSQGLQSDHLLNSCYTVRLIYGQEFLRNLDANVILFSPKIGSLMLLCFVIAHIDDTLLA
ncbi:hypothetical protein OIU76_004454 [Salix suchowensis]|nr:hypothetical protein OIU76_004454 [Salix suchowensis]